MARRKTIREERRVFFLEARIPRAVSDGPERWSLISGDGVYSGSITGHFIDSTWLNLRCSQGAARRMKAKLTELGIEKITVTAAIETFVIY